MMSHFSGHTHLVNYDVRKLIKRRSSLPTHTPILQHLEGNPIRDIGQLRLGSNVAVKPDRVPHQTTARLNRTGRLALFSAHTLCEGDSRDSARLRAEDLTRDTARELVLEDKCRKLSAFATPCFSAQDEDLVGGECLDDYIAMCCDWKGLALLLWREVSTVWAYCK